jgi:hypothetical protein
MNKICSSSRAGKCCVLNGNTYRPPVDITSAHDLSEVVKLRTLGSKSTAEVHRARDFRLLVL